MKKDPITSSVIGPDGKPVAGIQGAIMKAVGVQRPLVLAYLRRLRRKHPNHTAAELAKLVERDYLLAITGSGAAVGATAALPVVGTAAALGFSAAATVGFLEASALYGQSLAELHGITTENPDKARLLVMAILLGDEGSSMIAAFTHQAAGRGAGPVKGWAAMFGANKPASLWATMQGTMQKTFMKKMLATQGASMLGRIVPFGIGAAIGGVGNRYLGKRVVEAAGLAFGTIPTTIPGQLLVEPGSKSAPTEVSARAADGEADAAAEVEAQIEAERARRNTGR
ncbi:hypothetical protein ACSYDW_17265 [Paeniglutamicibacter sp. R2-26]|uniref:hypothetical protein n=1 Tax=Paeniglutamicibacter sp. R2-26 TaxID=3144417 RepID=UPI003EE51A1D